MIKYILFGASFQTYYKVSKDVFLLEFGDSRSLNLFGRTRSLLSRLLEIELRNYIYEGYLDRVSKILGIDKAYYSGNDAIAIVNGYVIHAPREYMLELLYQLRAFFRKNLYGSPRNTHVIDISAWVGDSSIYYASLGNTVIAIEPVERYYHYLNLNVRHNNLSHKIHTLNAAYSRNRDNVLIKEDGLCSRIVDIDGVAVKAINLSILYERYNLKDPFIKIDCEGCEYDLVEEILDSGLEFSGLCSEIHKIYGDSENLIEKLKSLGSCTIKINNNDTLITCVEPRK